jgi:hypothetical protein
MSRRTQSPLFAIFAIIIILIGLMIFMLVYDDLNRKLWVQGLIGLILATVVTVILFSIVYSSVQVRGAALWGGVLGIGGGALFYLLLLPYIKPFIFPTHSVSGYVYYKRDAAAGSLKAVRGVVAEVPDTGQKSAPTDESGRFVIDGVYAENAKILFRHAGETYPVNTADYKDGEYPIIDPPVTEQQPNKRTVDSARWKKDSGADCELERDKGFAKVRGFTLEDTLAKDDGEAARGARVLHLKVALPGAYGYLSQPGEDEPGGSIDFLEQGDRDGRAQGWEWEKADGRETKVKVSICVSTKPGEREPSAGDLQTLYWYGVLR